MKTTNLLMVLDRSGSMWTQWAELMQMCHDLQALCQQHRDALGEVLVTDVYFDHRTKVLNVALPIDEWVPGRGVQPEGTTAMFRAIQAALDEAEKKGFTNRAQNVANLCIIMTDGATHDADLIGPMTERIRELEATGQWTFLYLTTVDPGVSVLNQLRRQWDIFRPGNAVVAETAAGLRAATDTGFMRYIAARQQQQQQVNDFYAEAV